MYIYMLWTNSDYVVSLTTMYLIQPLDQGIIANFKKYYIKLTFSYILKKLENDKLSLTEVWKKFSILDCINHIIAAIVSLSWRLQAIHQSTVVTKTDHWLYGTKKQINWNPIFKRRKRFSTNSSQEDARFGLRRVAANYLMYNLKTSPCICTMKN